MKKDVIAVDLGGSRLRVGLVRGNRILNVIEKKTPKTSKLILKELYDSIEELMNKNVKFIGISSPGPLENGVLKNPPNLPFRNFDLRKAVYKRFKKKTYVENDANCVALAEARFGVKKKNFFILTLGTGIGGGVIINGELYKGKGYGGELGQIVLNNGKYFEDLVGSKAIHRLSRKYFGKKLDISDLIKMDNAKKVLNEISNYFGQGIASLVNIFDPELVVLSGGMEEGGSKFLNLIKKETKKYVFFPRKVDIRWSKLKNPGILGASLLG